MVNTYTDAIAYAQVRPLRGGETTSHEGGIVHAVDDWTRLRRFLILGSEGSFYQPGRELTIENVGVVRRCLDADAGRAIREIFEISNAGRAPKNEPALLALAMALRHPDVSTRRKAEQAFPDVVRTGTHLLHIAAYVTALSGKNSKISNRLLRRTFADWFLSKSANDLAYQAVKYPSRDGWALRDVLRLASPKPTSDLNPTLRYIAKGEVLVEVGSEITSLIYGVEQLKSATSDIVASSLIAAYDIPREAVPTHFLNSRDVWDALLTSGGGMPITAMVRNLAKMTAVGLLTDDITNSATLRVTMALANDEKLRKSRIHPMQLLVALKTYEQGHGDRGSLVWRPSKRIINALDEAFYRSFGSVGPTGKRIRLAVDASGSMQTGRVGGINLTPREAAAAMALVTANVEPNVDIVGFTTRMIRLDNEVRPSMRLDEVVRNIDRVARSEGTHCSIPITTAETAYDAIVSYTDNETWDGAFGRGGYDGSVADALRQYRSRYSTAARHAVLAFAANRISISDPNDPLSLDLVGLDAGTPQVLSEFIAGRV